MHSDPDALAMIAMGETDVPGDIRRHLEDCEDCATSLASLRRIADIARDGVSHGPLATPSPAVWSHISGELALGPDATPTPFDQPEPVSPPRRPRRHAARRRRWIPAVAAVAAVALAGGIVATIALSRGATPTVLSDVALEALPGWSGADGEALVEQDADGSREVTVTVDLPRADAGYREVWLLTPDSSGLISIGVLTADSGTFALPADVDLDEFSIVDVSQEALDGDPAHSGDSIVRGALES